MVANQLGNIQGSFTHMSGNSSGSRMTGGRLTSLSPCDVSSVMDLAQAFLHGGQITREEKWKLHGFLWIRL